MNWTNILETFIGALLAFMFGLLTQFLTRYFTEIKEKKKRIKAFSSYIQNNQKTLDEIKNAFDRCSTSDATFETIKTIVSMRNSAYRLYPIKDIYIQVMPELSKCSIETKDYLRRIVEFEEDLIFMQVEKNKKYQQKSDTTIQDEKKLNDEISKLTNNINFIQTLTNTVVTDLRRQGYWL